MANYGKYRPFANVNSIGTTDTELTKVVAKNEKGEWKGKLGTGLNSARATAHSEALVNPNVVRIEVLRPYARRRYLQSGLVDTSLNTLQAQQDLCKEVLIDNFATNAAQIYEPFYGITDQTSETVGFSLQTEWSSSGKSNPFATLVSSSMNATGEAAEKAGAMVGGAARLASNKAIKAMGGVAAGLFGVGAKVLEGTAQAFKELPAVFDGLGSTVGIDLDKSGACTLKNFGGSTLDSMKVITCKWYLPEQEKLCRLSINRLFNMAYGRGIDIMHWDLGKLYGFAADAMLGETGNVVNDNLKAIGNKEGNPNGATMEDGKIKGAIKWLVAGLLGGAGKIEGLVLDAFGTLANELADVNGARAFNAILSTFGNTMTMQPLPVRLTVGHILDIEPLVITQVDVTCSKEQFMSPDGTHLPIFVTAKIHFDMWMMPNPNTNFIQFMGDNIFREPPTPTAGSN